MGVLIQHVCDRLELEGAAPDLGMQVVSAYNEAFNNLAQYAYHGHEQDGDVELLMEVTQTHLALVLRDRGESFDLDAVYPPDLGQLPESGFGIFIMRSWMNEVRYEPKIDGETNILRMIKYLHAQPHPACSDPAQGTFDNA